MPTDPVPLNLPSLAGATVYLVDGPRGILRIAAHTDNRWLTQTLSELWADDGLSGLARALVAERQQYPATGQTLCHEVAFEFALGTALILQDLSDPLLRDWRWCVGSTHRGTHSWIEHLEEGFDSTIVLADGQPEQVLYVRQAAELRAFNQAVEIEGRTFFEFADWLREPRGPFFKRYPEADHVATQMRRERIDSGLLRFRRI